MFTIRITSAHHKLIMLMIVLCTLSHPVFSSQPAVRLQSDHFHAEDSILKKQKMFDDGCNAYKNGNYLHALEIFSAYKKQWPDEISGYYWNMRTHMSLDPTLDKGLAFQDALEIVRIAGKDELKNKAVLFTTYQYLLDYFTKVKKDATKENYYLKKIEGLDPRSL